MFRENETSARCVWGRVGLTFWGKSQVQTGKLLKNSEPRDYGTATQVGRPFDEFAVVGRYCQANLGLEDFNELFHSVLLSTQLFECP
jgi:hypothetical protein